MDTKDSANAYQLLVVTLSSKMEHDCDQHEDTKSDYVIGGKCIDIFDRYVDFLFYGSAFIRWAYKNKKYRQIQKTPTNNKMKKKYYIRILN